MRLTARYRDYEGKPANELLAVMVDAWRWDDFGGINEGFTLRVNRRLNYDFLRVQIYAGTLEGKRLVAGSVKMGQPILHPVQRFRRRQTLIPGGVNVHNFSWDWWVPAGPGHPPAWPYLVLMATIINAPLVPMVPISPPFEWAKLPHRRQNGGYLTD